MKKLCAKMKKFIHENSFILYTFSIIAAGVLIAVALFSFSAWYYAIVDSETVSIMPIDYLSSEQTTDRRFTLGTHSSKVTPEVTYYDYYEQDKTGAYKPVSEKVKEIRVIKDLDEGQQAYLTRDVCRSGETKNVILHLPEKTNIVEVDWK